MRSRTNWRRISSDRLRRSSAARAVAAVSSSPPAMSSSSTQRASSGRPCSRWACTARWRRSWLSTASARAVRSSARRRCSASSAPRELGEQVERALRRALAQGALRELERLVSDGPPSPLGRLDELRSQRRGVGEAAQRSELGLEHDSVELREARLGRVDASRALEQGLRGFDLPGPRARGGHTPPALRPLRLPSRPRSMPGPGPPVRCGRRPGRAGNALAGSRLAGRASLAPRRAHRRPARARRRAARGKPERRRVRLGSRRAQLRGAHVLGHTHRRRAPPEPPPARSSWCRRRMARSGVIESERASREASIAKAVLACAARRIDTMPGVSTRDLRTRSSRRRWTVEPVPFVAPAARRGVGGRMRSKLASSPAQPTSTRALKK
jgi:hypothetical protein